MLYVSALKYSAGFKRLIDLTLVLLLIPPLGMLLVFYLLIRGSGLGLTELPSGYLMLLLVLLPLTAVGYLIIKLLYRRQISTRVEISAEGVHHLCPGKERMFTWDEVQRVDLVKIGNRAGSVRLKLSRSYYVFDPYLVEDQPDSLQIRLGLGGMRWYLSDGTRLKASVENSAGYRAVAQYRPEFL